MNQPIKFLIKLIFLSLVFKLSCVAQTYEIMEVPPIPEGVNKSTKIEERVEQEGLIYVEGYKFSPEQMKSLNNRIKNQRPEQIKDFEKRLKTSAPNVKYDWGK